MGDHDLARVELDTSQSSVVSMRAEPLPCVVQRGFEVLLHATIAQHHIGPMNRQCVQSILASGGDPFQLYFTSGTSGVPQCAALTHDMVASQTLGAVVRGGFDAAARHVAGL